MWILNDAPRSFGMQYENFTLQSIIFNPLLSVAMHNFELPSSAATNSLKNLEQGVPQGQAAGYATARLQAWGYVQRPPQPR